MDEDYKGGLWSRLISRFLRQCVICAGLLALVMCAALLKPYTRGIIKADALDSAARLLIARLTEETDITDLRALLKLEATKPDVPEAAPASAASAPPAANAPQTSNAAEGEEPTSRVRVDGNMLFEILNAQDDYNAPPSE